MWIRTLEPVLKEHLQTMRQMIFITGPRQCGKTTLAKGLLGQVLPKWNYFNWDLLEHRRFLLKEVFPGNFKLDQENHNQICFDEIHKYKRWKNALKGLFDHYEPSHSHWIVTGSAMLNVFRKGQDSLLGRHFTYHLFPFSIAESCQSTHQKPLKFDEILSNQHQAPSPKQIENQNLLLEFSGFPEPLFKREKSFLSRWRTTRLERLIQQDLAQTEHVNNLPMIEHLMFLLPDKIGNPLSINSLREDLEVHFTTVKHWLDLLERVFYIFRIKCYSKKLPKLLKKEEKVYLWDWTEIEEPGRRFENFTALHLLKYVFFCNESGIENLSLFYLKDRNQREVDFLICSKGKPEVAIECKLSDTHPSKQLLYFAKALKISKCILLVKNLEIPRVIDCEGVQVSVLPSASFLGGLNV